MADLIYIDKVPAAERRDFTIKLLAVSKLLGVDPNWLMQIFKAESGVRADIRNTFAPFYKYLKGVKTLDGYATGLIQFTPDTARRLGTTTTALEKMTRTQQLDWVYLYLKKYAGKLKSYFDVYLVVFFPAAVPYSNDPNYVFEVKNISRTAVAKANPAIDINKDGKITMGEFRQYLMNTVKSQFQDAVFGPLKAVSDFVVANPGESAGIGGGVVVAALLIMFLMRKK